MSKRSSPSFLTRCPKVKRITNGSEDNVAVYFKVLVTEYWTDRD